MAVVDRGCAWRHQSSSMASRSLDSPSGKPPAGCACPSLLGTHPSVQVMAANHQRLMLCPENTRTQNKDTPCCHSSQWPKPGQWPGSCSFPRAGPPGSKLHGEQGTRNHSKHGCWTSALSSKLYQHYWSPAQSGPGALGPGTLWGGAGTGSRLVLQWYWDPLGGTRPGHSNKVL